MTDPLARATRMRDDLAWFINAIPQAAPLNRMRHRERDLLEDAQAAADRIIRLLQKAAPDAD